MRINDKHLATFAVGNSPIDKEGFLFKRGEVNKAFQKRWFVLKGNLLFYFEKKGDRDPIGVIILEGCTVELAELSDAYTFELVFQGSGSRTYVLSAESQEDMENWMKAIACAGYDYMKLMVAELQRQLDEINNEKSGSNSVVQTASSSRVSSSRAAQSSTTENSLLVDLAQGEAKGQARFNPFDGKKQPLYENVDLFGATPFEPSVSQKERTFEQMHEQFGEYIQKKMAEIKPQ